MATEYYNSQWQMPNEANKSKSANYSLKSNSAALHIKIPGLANSLNLTDKVSISIWFKTTLSQNNYYILGFRGPSSANGFDLGMHGSNVGSYAAFATSGSGGLLVNFAYDDGNWHHYVLTYDGTIRKFYIDGILKAESAASGNVSLDSSGNYFILATNDSFVRGGQGEAVDNCVFDYALSDGGVSVGSTATGQIAQLYGNGSSLSNPMDLSPAPKAYYKLSDSIWNGSSYITPNLAVQDYVFNFNGSSDYITASDSTAYSSYSTSCWINADSLANYTRLISLDDSANNLRYLGLHGDGTLISGHKVGGSWNQLFTSSAITTSTWNHIVLVDNGTNTKIYVNKVENTLSNTASVDGPNYYIGSYNGGGNFFDGKMSNVQIFNTALSSTDIETLYNYGSPIRTLANIPQSSNLKAWYKLDASEIYNSTSTEWEVYNNAGYEKTYSFNGSNNIQIPNNSSIQPTNWTIGFWVKGFGQNGTYLFNNSPNGWNIKSSGNDIIISIGTSQSTAHRTATNALNGKWNYIVFSYDGTNVRGSLNNSYLGYNGASGQTYDSSNLFIGSYSDGTNGFIGEIGQILFWNTRKNNAEGWNATTQKPITSLPTPQSSNNDNLVSWWKLDTAIITDSFGSNTGINNEAILSNTIIGRPTVIGDGNSSGMSQSNLIQSDLSRVFNDNALSIPGSSSRYALTLSGFYPSSGSFTFSMWLRNSSTNRQGVFSKGSGWTATEFGVAIPGGGGDFTSAGSADNGKLVFMFDTTSAPSSSYLATSEVLEINKWYNFVATYTPGDLKLYLNGSLDNSTTSITKNTFSDQRVRINNCLVNGWNFGGQSSNFAFFDTVLSSSEVREIWNNGLPGDLKSHSKAANLKNWVKGARGAGNQVLLDYVGPIAFTGSYTYGPSISTGFTDYIGVSSGFSAPSNTVANIVTNAPYSDKNAISINMQSTNSGAISNTWTTPTSGRTTETP